MPPIPKPRPKPEYAIGDRDFDQELMPLLDDVAKLGYDPSVAHYLFQMGKGGAFGPVTFTASGPVQSRIHGYYIGERENPADYDSYREKSGLASLDAGHVYVTPGWHGDDQARTYAHEFRHRGYDKVRNYLRDMPIGGLVSLAEDLKNKDSKEAGIISRFLMTHGPYLDPMEKIIEGDNESEEYWVRTRDRNDKKSGQMRGRLDPPQVAGGIARMLYEKMIEEGLAKAKEKSK